MQAQKEVQEASRPSTALSRADHRASLWLYRTVGMRVPRWVVMTLEHTGSGVIWLPLVPALWYAVEGPALRTVLANFFLGMWVDICYVGALKGLIQRKRPVYNHKGDFVVIVAVDQFSFPSGHAARVSFIATFTLVVFAATYFWPAVGVAVWALAVAASRAAMGRHYVGDVVAGLLLGLVTTATVFKGSYSAEHAWISAAQSEHWHAWAVAKVAELWHRLPQKLQ